MATHRAHTRNRTQLVALATFTVLALAAALPALAGDAAAAEDPVTLTCRGGAPVLAYASTTPATATADGLPFTDTTALRVERWLEPGKPHTATVVADGRTWHLTLDACTLPVSGLPAT